MKNVLILGGDGYLGWPTAMFLSSKNYNVTVVDNYFRRKICLDKNIKSLLSNPDLIERVKIWNNKTGKEIKVVIGDLTDIDFTESLFNGSTQYDWSLTNSNNKPETVIHFAEQPSAPYSMIDSEKSNFTLINNIISTNNLINSIKKNNPEIHIIKLGTMGEYGTPDIDIEEGWLNIKHKGRSQKFLYPRQASSIYHTSKIMDTDLLWFAVRTWKLKVTDLMQGPVYGIFTEQTEIDNNLSTIFNYDEIFGTVVNRFITQAVIGYPLTVYGKGNQTRGYINLVDSLRCIEIAVRNEPKTGELRIFNQISETMSVNQIAKKIDIVCKSLGIKTTIENKLNPRIEKEDHYYNPKYQALKDLGFKPNYFNEHIITKIINEVNKYKHKINKDVIFNGVQW